MQTKEARRVELTDEMIYELAPFARTLGVQAEESTPSEVRVRLPHREELSTIGGGMHGGALMSLCDLAAAICFIASDDARFVNGTTLAVDGGRLDILP